jgi:hypothetical protein
MEHNCVEEHELVVMQHGLTRLLLELQQVSDPAPAEVEAHAVQFVYDSIYKSALMIGEAISLLGHGDPIESLASEACVDISPADRTKLKQSPSMKRLGAVFDELCELAEQTRPVVKARY